MQTQKSLEFIRPELLLQIRDAPPPDIRPLRIPDKWVASSLLQKAVRRGQSGYALAAVRFLHQLDPRIIWRRLPLIGWEDVSFGDVEVCCIASELARSKRLRSQLGGDWQVAAWVTQRLCRSTKNRITDDLITALEHAPVSPDIIAQVEQMSDGHLRALATANERCILWRTAATWLLCGTDKFPSEAMPRRKGDLANMFASFGQSALSPQLASIGVAASKATRTIFPAIVAMLWQDWMDCRADETPVEDSLNWNNAIGDIPAYAYDGHTAKGSRYLRKLGRMDEDLALWLFEWLPAEQHVVLLKKLAFRSVASLCNRRQSWGEVEKVRQLADRCGFYLEPKVFAEGMELFRAASRRFPIEEIG